MKNKFGWVAKDSTGHVWRSTDFDEVGKATAWSQLVSYLEISNKHLTHLLLKWGAVSYALPKNADAYAIHYNMELELGSENVAKRYIVGTAIKGTMATVREVDENGHVSLNYAPAKDIQLMRPSPLAK